MDELRKALDQLRKSAPFNEHAKAVVTFATVATGVLEAQAAQLADLADKVQTLTPPEG